MPVHRLLQYPFDHWVVAGWKQVSPAHSVKYVQAEPLDWFVAVPPPVPPVPPPVAPVPPPVAVPPPVPPATQLPAMQVPVLQVVFSQQA
jgi:hypothetical protein